jgi:2-oxoisovalerate dehydrogenase E2 component (dihydrolipoyl transacylase)
VKEGDIVKQFDKIAEVQSDKASVEITSRYDGKIGKIYGNPGDMIKVGEPLLDVVSEVDGEPSPEQSDIKVMALKVASLEKAKENEEASTVKVLATPAVRGSARQRGILLHEIKGSGAEGRILLKDLDGENAGFKIQLENSSFSPIPLNAIQKAMLKSMTTSMEIPHFGYTESIHMDNLMALRSKLQAEFESKITFLSILIKITGECLLAFPILNSQLTQSPDGEYHVSQSKKINICIAMDTPNGLMIPSIKDVTSKSILTIASELELLQVKGQSGHFSREDLSGGTFTLSNIGAIGSGISAFPIIPSPQVCIGALSKVRRIIAVHPQLTNNKNSSLEVFGLRSNEEIRILSEMTVDWSADHRLVDGATMARFSSKWKYLAENPELLIANLE